CVKYFFRFQEKLMPYKEREGSYGEEKQVGKKS
ncbi:MAG: hypothetical protein PWQ60_2163, partial [Thermoanaerobacteraceae bacterium]|nr:hypothetical protein [Thermoanaerobacteraceae bacterium]